MSFVYSGQKDNNGFQLTSATLRKCRRKQVLKIDRCVEKNLLNVMETI